MRSTPTDSAPWTPPTSFEEYRLVRRLGAGAMGEVYLAHDTLLDRPVAVKLIAQGAVDEGRRERFRVETRAIARLQHPNVVTVYRVGEVRRRPYLVSEYVRGRSLRELPKPLAWEEVLRIGIGLARGLAAAHRRGVLHRDIKPANVMVTEDGEVKLLDFGLAKIFDEVREPLDSPEPSPPAPVEPEARSATRSAPGREPTAAASASEPTLPAPDGLPATGAEPPAHPGAMSSEQRALTLSGTLLGTPLYMAPEIWRGEPASPRADVYSLGVVLHELCAGRTPHHDLSMHELARAVPTRRAAPLATVVPGVDAHLAAVIDRCLALSPEERFASGDALREALERLEEGRRGEDAVGGRPYPGLHPFEPADRSMFFGRGVEVRTILDRLRAEPLVVVAGDSGVGKSSLCRAGVLPRVMEGALGGGSWTVVTLVPGRDPLGALAGALGPHLSVDEAALVEEMRAEPRALGRRLGASAGTRGLLVFVDQMEELLTLSAEAEARAAADALAVLAGGLPGVRVLGTARGDFLTRLASLPGIGPLLSGALYLLAPLGEAELREAIVGPARARGFAFESEPLVDVLVQAGRTEGALPLLQFALAELWEARDPERRVIPAAALERMGGVTGALARHADNVLARLLPEERAAARHVLLRLVTVEGTRARRRESELVEAGDAKGRAARVAIEALVSGRLVVAREAEGAEHVGTYELAHEALTTGWETLRRWLVDDVEARAARERLEQAAREWVRLGRPAEGLWNERQLAEVAGLDQGSWMDAERAFVATSRRVASRRRWIRLGAIAALPLTGLLVYGGVRWRDHSERSRQVTLHVRVADEALQGIEDRVSQAEALRQRAFGAFDAGRGAEGEQRWAEALVVQQEVAQRYREAAEALEAALLRDTERADVRRRLGEVILQQILLAEQEHRPAAREELTRRLATFDDSGELRARLSAPARLGVVTRPPGAEVWIERYEDEGGRLRPGPARPLGRTPLEDVPIESGSYRLAMRVPGRPQIHETVLLGRGERYVVEVDLPERIPEGFVYVPAGRFLFGSRDDEAVRANFLVAQPLHQTRTGAFLISRYEVSYGEWLEFLRDLPPAEQERRRPRVDSFSRGTIELARTAGGRWRLQYIPPSLSSPFVYTVMEGERFHYEQRTLRADQDWLRFPVSGVSWEDSLAYLGWLRRTGRVPGARFCEVREWERAARGADGRSYPHGERLEPDDTNYDQTYGQRELAFGPDEVGAHPASASPFGVEDMAGNVREWVHWRHVPEEPHYGGGCFYYDRLTSRVYVHATDLRSKPAQREPLIGLRVCADAR